MEDKRRRARVQGAWATPPKSQATAQPATTAGSHLSQTLRQTWRSKEQQLSGRNFVFKEPQLVIRTAPEHRVIELPATRHPAKAAAVEKEQQEEEKQEEEQEEEEDGQQEEQQQEEEKQTQQHEEHEEEQQEEEGQEEEQQELEEQQEEDREGVYEISLSPTGVSRVCLYPGFVDVKEADWILEQLCQDVPWKQRMGIREDITYPQPRLTAWYGELPYTYSRITMEPNPHWHPVLCTLKSRIEENTGHTFNSLLCNLYRDEKDSVDWHSDDEPSLGSCPVIASLSFGATRTFEMRKKPPPEENGDYTYVERVKIPLDHGTLLIMEGATQADWQHRVPKEYHSREPRVNLTFRTIYPDTGGGPW